jgi:hypothetical protein
MGFEPWRPQGWTSSGQDLKAADEDVVRTLAEIEKASTPLPSATSNTALQPGMPDPQVHMGVSRAPTAVANSLVIAFGAAIGFVILGLNFLYRHPSTGQSRRGPARVIARSSLNPALQAEAEQLLQKAAAGDSGAADEVIARSANWTGKTHRTPVSEQWIGVALNSADLHTRAAALQAEPALDGVSVDDAGLKFVEQAVGNPSQRVWALWMLGALGNRGVDPVHAAKVIDAYMADSQVDVRAAAVNALGLIGTDETIPPMLDRFRNDPSPVVQERAACSLAESGMYTHEQRMTVAGTLVGWLDDASLSGPQREWTLHALRDISGKNPGADSGSWREWYSGAH